MALAYLRYALIYVRRDEDADKVLVFAEHIFSASSYEDARSFLSRLADGVALYAEKILLRHLVIVEGIVRNEGHVHMEHEVQKALLLVVLLEAFLAESAFACRKVKYLLVVELASEHIRYFLCHDVSAAAELSSDAYNDIVVLHIMWCILL